MARVTVVGNAVVITSSMKLDDLKVVQKFRPDALVLRDEHNEPVFAIGIGTGNGAVNKYGVTFGGASRNAEGKAVATLDAANFPGDDIRQAIADGIGGALVQLQKLEETLPAILAEITAERSAVMERITLA